MTIPSRNTPLWVCLVLITLVLIAAAPAEAVAQTWLDAAWTYRAAVTVDNSSNASVLTNYPVRVDLSTGFDFTHAQAAGQDVRLTAADGTTPLDYWIEFWDNVGDTAIVWVEVPSVPASSTIDVYMYYGNGVAADAADGSATFEFFDDFASGTIDPLKWNTLGGTPTVSGGIVTINTASTAIQSVPLFQYKAMRTRSRFATYVPYGAIGFIDAATSVGTHDAMFSMGWTANNVRAISSGVPGGSFEFGPDYAEGTGFKTWEVKRQSAAQVDFVVNDSLRYSATTPINISTQNLHAQVNSHSGAPDIKTDWALVRNYTSPEPAATNGVEEVDSWTITASAGANGSISPTGAVTVSNGANQTFTITPNAGYHVLDVLVDGGSVGAVTNYDFINVTADHSISATFAIDTWTLTSSAGANGSISPLGAVVVSHGTNQTFTITPNAGYHVLDVLVDGGSVGAVTSYDFISVTADHSISATFAIDTWTITSSAGANGAISPLGAVVVNNGANQTFTITPNTGYHVLDVLVDGGSVGAVTSYDFISVTADHSISVTFAIDTWTLTSSAGLNGSISPIGAVVVINGANQTFTVTPDAGYRILDVLVDGGSVGAMSSYTFTNVTANHSINATFELDTYTITATAGANGLISPSGAVVVNAGANQTFTITPDPGYHVLDVLVDGGSVGAVTSHTFTNVTQNHSINATFAIDTWTLTSSAGVNGSISPLGAIVVNSGANQTFTITPNAGYHVLDVLVDGLSVGAVTSHTFTNVTANHSISATFEIDTWTITATAGANGTINPVGAVVVTNGANQGFTITPAPGYHVLDVLVDGISEGPITSYIFSNVTANHSISATFEIDIWTLTSSAGANGAISPLGAVVVNNGANQTFMITPNAGYHVLDVLVDGLSVGAVTSYDFINVTADHSISATFELDTWTLTSSAGANGTISPLGAIVVNNGVNQTFTITPDPGYHVLDVLVDGGSVGAVTSYDFINVTADHSISATFAIDTWTLTSSAGLNGTISPLGAIVVNNGTNQAFTIAPDPGYHVLDVLVDGISVGAVTNHTFTNVTADHSISVTFAIDTWTLTSSAGANGTISPLGVLVVNNGVNQTYTMTPDPGFQAFNVTVDGVSLGSLTSYTFTNVTADHSIDVTFGPIVSLFTITASAGANGTITPSGSIVVVGGSNQSFSITPDPGYHVLDVLVDGGSVGAVTSYNFINVTVDHSISATFEIDMWTIAASAGANGVITPSGAIIVNNGTNQTFTITPDAGYHVLDVVVDGGSVGPVTSHTFTNVTADHSISATFEIDTWTITSAAGSDGAISPLGAVIVNNGANQAFTITPDPGYHVLDVLVDGGTVGAITTYTFTNVTTDHSISVSFGIDTWNITASAGADGSINPVGTVIVNHGANQIFTMTPDVGYRVLDVTVDGGSVGAVTSYTFTNVTSDHTIHATFALNLWTVTATAGPDGSITPSGAIDVNPGASQAFSIAADPGFGILDVVVDGSSVGAVPTYTFTNVTADHTIHATFIGIPAVITSSPVTSGQIAVLYTYDINATGTPVPTYALLSNPSGMTIDTVSGLVQWTPSTSGSFPVSLVARNSAGADTQSYAIQVLEPALITTTPITNGVVGRPYTYNVDASGSPPPTFSLLTFPSGMTIVPVTGLIQWTPSAEGTFNVSVVADNGVGSDTQSYSITVITLPDIPTLISPIHLAVTADNTPTLIWSATSGVGGTYTLQYSRSADFTTGVVEITSLVDTTFTIAGVDSLVDGLWFWRVQAIDQLARQSGYQPVPFLFTVDTQPPPVPILLAPVNQAVINDNTPSLDWVNPSLITVTYTLEYSSDSLFGSSVVIIGLTASEHTIMIPMADGDYFWHVSATKQQGVSSGFQAVPFRFTINSSAPAVPILRTPPHQTFTTYVTPRFSWLDVQPPLMGARASGGHTPGASMAATTYSLQYSTDPSFATYSVVTGIPDTFYVIPDSVPLAVTTWYWRVEKVDGAGNQSGFQSAFQLGLFVPGDQVMDLGVTAADVIWLVNYVFKGGLPPLPCPAAGDVTCDGSVTSADIIHLVNYVFKSGEVPCEIGDVIADGTWDCP